MFSNLDFKKVSSFFLLLVAVDQLSKYLIRRLGGFSICNPGIAWGIPISPLFFWSLGGTLFFLALWAVIKEMVSDKSDLKQMFCWTLILGGASSNFIDRIGLGCVFDFINLGFWPTFNLADVFIVVGSLFLLVNWRKI